MQLEVGQGTNTGMIRSGNEDSYFSDPEHGLFVVADGMGGHAAGEVASDMAVRILADELREVHTTPGDEIPRRVEQSFKHANLAIYQRTLTEVDKQGMGTTTSLLLLRGSRYLIGQVGDSRVYLLRDGTHVVDSGRAVGAGHGRDVGGAHRLLRRDLVAHQRHHVGRDGKSDQRFDTGLYGPPDRPDRRRWSGCEL